MARMSADVPIARERGDVGAVQPVASKLAAVDLFPFQRGVKNFSGTDLLSNVALLVPSDFC